MKKFIIKVDASIINDEYSADHYVADDSVETPEIDMSDKEWYKMMRWMYQIDSRLIDEDTWGRYDTNRRYTGYVLATGTPDRRCKLGWRWDYDPIDPDDTEEEDN